jgi:hypothetical protein
VSLQRDMDDSVRSIGELVLIAVAVTCLIAASGLLYKVWNERQMTHVFARQARAQERTAGALELLSDLTKRCHKAVIRQRGGGWELAVQCDIMDWVPAARSL